MSLGISEKSGLTSVLDDMGAGSGAVPVSSHEQMSLLDDESPVDEAGATNQPQKRGAGRPAGAINKSTKEWRDFLASRGKDPLCFLQDVLAMTPEEMARQGIKAQDMLKTKVNAAVALAPYMHKKQPIEVDAGDGGLIGINIFRAPEAAIDATNSAEFIIDGNYINQGLSESDNQKSNNHESDNLLQHTDNSDYFADKTADYKSAELPANEVQS